MFRETGCYPVSTNGMGLFGGGYNLFDDGYELVVVVVVGVGAEEYGFVVLECHLFRAGVVVVIVEESVGEHLVGGVVPVPFAIAFYDVMPVGLHESPSLGDNDIAHVFFADFFF